jgi:oligopeptide transport system substrate-binding protein
MLRLVVPILVLAAVVAAFLVSDRPLPRADLTYINRSDITTLDPAHMSWMHELRLGHVLYEGLTSNDVFTWDFAVTPAVAERWEVSDDLKRYTFHIRPEAKWSNGEPVRASDFVFSWRRLILPDSAADFTGFVLNIRGAKEFFDWRQKATADFAAGRGETRDAGELWERTLERFDKTVGVHAADERTLVVDLERPVPYFLQLCGFPGLFPVYPPLVSRYESPDPVSGRIVSRRDWTKPPLLVGNGPFTLASWRFKRDMRFEKSRTYWGRDTVAIDSINMPTIADLNAQVLAFQTGAIDCVIDVSARYRTEMLADKLRFYEEHRAEYDRLRAEGWDQFEIDRRLPPDPRKSIHVVPAFGTYFYNFNCRPKLSDGRDNPFADKRVRRAFAMAIDRKALSEEVMRIGTPVVTTIIPPGSIPGYSSPKGVGFDPEGARKLLADAGYTGESFPVTVEILFNKEGEHDLIAQFVAKNWAEYLGVQVALAQKEIKTFRADLKKGNFMVTRAGWFGDYADPTSFLDISRSWDGNNDRGYKDAAYDGLMERAAAELDPAARMAILEEAERKLMDEDLPMTPLFQQVTLYLFDPAKLGGFNTHPRTDQRMGLVDMLGDGKGPDKARAMPMRPSAAGRPARGE